MTCIKRVHSSPLGALQAIIRKGLSHLLMEPVLIDAQSIRRLDLSPLRIWSEQPLNELLEQARSFRAIPLQRLHLLVVISVPVR